MHQKNAQRHHVRLAVGTALFTLFAWATTPAFADGPILALTNQVDPPDPNTLATALLVASMATVIAIKRKHPELGLFPIAPIPMPPEPLPRRRSRR